MPVLPASAYRNMFDLTGRIAVVTGGGTGIGLMITHGLATHGAKVYITGRRLEVLQKVADDWNTKEEGVGKLIPLQMDVTNKEDILKVKDYLTQTEGRVHILVNNAGQVGPHSSFMSNPNAPERKDADALGLGLFGEPWQAWNQIYDINTFSVFFVTTAFLGLLDKGSKDVEGYLASVINVTSISGVIKLSQDHFAYNSGKAAASHLTKMLATELMVKGVPVRVNAVAPGVYASEMTFDEILPEQVDNIGKGLHSVPMRRAGTQQEVAGTVVWLASRAGGYVTGQEIIVDGGYVAVNPTI